MKKKVLILCIVTFIITLSTIFTLPIFGITKNISTYYSKKTGRTKEVICLLEYHYNTGSGWIIVDSNNEELINKEILLNTTFDPRLLKDNKEYDLDYRAKFIVSVKGMNDVIFDSEKETVLYANEINIIFDTKKEYYSFFDMSLEGILKSILGIFNKKYRLSY